MSWRYYLIIQIIMLIVLALLCGNSEAKDLHYQTTIGTGVFYTHNAQLIEGGIIYDLKEWLHLNANVGFFGHDTKYVDTGLSLSYSRFTLGVTAVYMDNAPTDTMSMHSQFKPNLGIRLFKNVSLKYVHFSNASRKDPNNGKDFLTLEVRF